ncbi:MAG: hypothetical protein QOG89_3480, partial [Thermomicrobiales bacterium]|nr:hypothetical protein [Thermomicrobiales bacterium]
AVAFLMFAVLVVAWLMAPSGEVKAKAPKALVSKLQIGEARA